MKKLNQLNIPEIKQAHGGKRAGAGRKKGSTRKEPTKAIRVPLSLLSEVEKLIAAHQSDQDKPEKEKGNE